MLSSMAIQSAVSRAFAFYPFPAQKPRFKHFPATILGDPKSHLINSLISLDQRNKPCSRNGKFSALAAAEALTTSGTPFQEEAVAEAAEEGEEEDEEEYEEEEGDDEGETGGPKLVLKFIWMEKNLGLALDQMIPGYGTIPLTPYYFWPRNDAWEELKAALEKKPWISQKRMIILLNQATDIINLWQQGGGNLST